jgi:hypothetical protein
MMACAFGGMVLSSSHETGDSDMKPWIAGLIGLAWALAMGGCTTLPSLSKVPAASPDPASIESIPTAMDVVDHIECVLYDLLDEKDDTFKDLQAGFVVFASLTLEVTDDGSLDPSLSFIHPLSVTDMTRKLLGITGKYDAAAHRTYQHEFTILLDKATRDRAKYQERCPHPALRGQGLSGDLGLRSIVAQGLKRIRKGQFIFPVVPESESVYSWLSLPALPTFGSTIDFTVTYGLGINPTWTLVHFEGPGSDAGLLNVSRATKDTLVITFAPPVEEGPAKPAPEAVAPLGRAVVPTRADRNAAAARAAQDAATRMLLRQLPFR